MTQEYVYIFSSLYGAFSLLLLVAALHDVWKLVIPNPVVVAVAALFVLATIILPFETDWVSHGGAAAVVFVAGAAAYRFKLLGAGDVKLLAAVSLWSGFDHLVALILYVSLVGGGLALLLLGLRISLVGLAVMQPTTNSRFLLRLRGGGANVPYGVAIAAGSIIVGRDLPLLGLYL